jgi:hypothetical protein
MPTGESRGAAGHRLALMVAVDCRIQVSEQHAVRTVSIAGRLTDAQVPDLLTACAQTATTLRVDLTDLLSADTIAVETLRRIRDDGAELVGVLPYIQLKVDSLAPRPRGL